MNKILAVLFSLLTLITGTSAPSKQYEYVEIGSYPQSLVTSEALISGLESLEKEWISYGYYSGSGSESSAKQGDYMMYADVTLNGDKYRAVLFSDYRPMKTYANHSSSTYQDDNGYKCNSVYWFKFEPLKWRVLSKEKGILMCESIVDSQPFNNTLYSSGGAYYSDAQHKNLAHDYASSSIRSWLNDDFYNTAFSEEEKALIAEYTCEQQFYPRNKAGGEMTVTDNVFMLSREEATSTSLGFASSINSADSARRGKGTEYAKCQGLHVCETGFGHKNNSCWWLRAPGYYSKRVNKIFYDGYCSVDSYYDVTLTDIGVRPCIVCNVK